MDTLCVIILQHGGSWDKTEHLIYCCVAVPIDCRRAVGNPQICIFRWFKFTLQPPYTIMHRHLLLAIWGTSYWTSFVKFGLKTAWDISYDILWLILKYVNFWQNWMSSENQFFLDDCLRMHHTLGDVKFIGWSPGTFQTTTPSQSELEMVITNSYACRTTINPPPSENDSESWWQSNNKQHRDQQLWWDHHHILPEWQWDQDSHYFKHYRDYHIFPKWDWLWSEQWENIIQGVIKTKFTG